MDKKKKDMEEKEEQSTQDEGEYKPEPGVGGAGTAEDYYGGQSTEDMEKPEKEEGLPQ